MGMKLSEWLKLSRKQSGLTLEQVAEAMGRSKGAVSHWENDNNEPSYWQVIALYELTGRRVPLPTLSGAPVEMKGDLLTAMAVEVSPAARSLMSQVARADQEGVSSGVFRAMGDLLKTITNRDRPDDEVDLPHMQP
jgi:transcriptional regulator with XRE-family HTH domain